MKYENIKEAIFLERPNRFIAHGTVDGHEEVIHVKNTGRCKELLVSGAKIYLEEFDNPNRKTKWDLIAVEKGNTLINMDSQAPNKVVGEWLVGSGLEDFQSITTIKPEARYKSSRFDFYLETEEKKIYIEVKGVTLEVDGVAKFPDAPSLRAVKHVEELIQAKEEGYEAYVIFVIKMKGIKYFTPNDLTHPEFKEVLIKAKEKGAKLLAYDCIVRPNQLVIDEPVRIRL
jgi:sugar fermentation stimulation protein